MFRRKQILWCYQCHHLLILLFLFTFIPTTRSEMLSEREALIRFKWAIEMNEFGLRELNWNESDSHCSWIGVTCEDGAVTSIVLTESVLWGTIYDDTLGYLTQLRTLDLSRTLLINGRIPADISNCSKLQTLRLNGNRFNGSIAPVLSLRSLRILDLANNEFEGEIPWELNNLVQLEVLLLQSNSFKGSLPDLDLPKLSQFNVSYNIYLEGHIPPKLQHMPADAFKITSLCGPPLSRRPCYVETQDMDERVLLGSLVGSLIGIFNYRVAIRRERGRSAPTVRGVVEGGINPTTDVAIAVSTEANTTTKKSIKFFSDTLKYDIEDLLTDTAELLGKGMFGTSYKVVLDIGAIMVVKVLKGVSIPDLEFKEKMEVVGAMKHPNLVTLRGYCSTKDEKYLVHDYMPNGNLSALIHENRESDRTTLDWRTRLQIANGIACGICHIHSISPVVSHGNIKSSNILFDESKEVRISEQCVAQLIQPETTPEQQVSYLAPEEICARNFSQKADVYSFGVLMLELVAGKAPDQPLQNESFDLPRWILSVERDEWPVEVFDMELLDHPDAHYQIMKLLDLAMECIAQYPQKRPTMFEIVSRIERIQ